MKLIKWTLYYENIFVKEKIENIQYLYIIFLLSKWLKRSKLLLKFSKCTRFFMTVHKYTWLSETIRLTFLTAYCESGRSRQASWESMPYLGSYLMSGVCAPNAKPPLPPSPHCYHRISISREAVFVLYAITWWVISVIGAYFSEIYWRQESQQPAELA